MKAILVLCLLAVFAVQPTPALRNPHHTKFHNERLPDFIQNIIDNLLEVLRGVIDKIREAIDNIVGGGTGDLGDFLDKIINFVKDKIKEIKDKIDGMEDEYACAMEQQAALQKLMNQVQTDAQECVDVATKKIADVQTKLIDLEDEVIMQIQNIMEVVSKCSEGEPLEIVACVLKELSTISSAVSKIVEDAKELINIFSNEVAGIVTEAKTCITDVVDAAQIEMDKINQAVDECLNSMTTVAPQYKH